MRFLMRTGDNFLKMSQIGISINIGWKDILFFSKAIVSDGSHPH